ncbi:MAG TPA: aryl-sulfate sulfotransferase [Vicinamibacterales bacterium]|nr:aryl-sulfate sulfotransferase [Vicinamibacterales bacterium]
MRRYLSALLIAAAAATTAARTPADLPADLQAIKFIASGTLSSQYALVHLFAEKGFKGYAIVDSGGRVVWHYRTKDYPFGADRRKNGNFVFMDKGAGLVEVDRAGRVVHVLAQRDADHEMHHAIAVTPRDTVLYLAFDTQEFAGKPLKGEAIWEWNPETGENIKRWRSWDFMDPSLDRSARTAGEWLHGNSLHVGPRGNVLLSLHYINQVISIAPDWQSLEWRFGGVRPTITVPPDDQTSAQHTAAEIEPNRLLMFDNRTGLQPPFSRAIEYVIEGRTAKAVWQWASPTRTYASAVSSARRLPNGNTLIAFGMEKGRNGSSGPTEAFEVTRAGDVQWHLLVEGVMTMFRVEPVNSFVP